MKTLTLLIFSQIFLCMIDLRGSAVKARPNILWLVVEDQSKHYGFNGEKLVHNLLLVMEAMKMEHRIVANVDGVIAMMNLKEGDQVQQGDVLLEISE